MSTFTTWKSARISNPSWNSARRKSTAVSGSSRLSKSYETSAAKQYSKVEKYTILSEGNELKLQAIANLENAIASYLAMPLSADKAVAANTAPERHNGEALGFDPNESGEDDSNTNGGKKPAQKPAATVADNTQKPISPDFSPVRYCFKSALR